MEFLGPLLARCVPVQVAAADMVCGSDAVHVVNAVSVTSWGGPRLRLLIRIHIFYRSVA
jgi:hypothetical protein